MNKILFVSSMAVQTVIGAIALAALCAAAIVEGNDEALVLAVGACALLCFAHAVVASWSLFFWNADNGLPCARPAAPPKLAPALYIASIACAALALAALITT